jgi:hypothetical protein
MNRFHLNLIRDQVPSLVRRRLRFTAMVAYLAIAGAVLALAVGLASSRASLALEFRSQSQKMEASFTAAHEGQVGLQQGLARLQTRLASQLDSLKVVDERLSGDPRPARFLRALVLSLPPNMALYKVSLNADEKTVFIDVKVFGAAAGSIGAPELMNLWQQDPAIAAEIVQLAQLGSQVENTGAGGNTILQFSGRLEKRGR